MERYIGLPFAYNIFQGDWSRDNGFSVFPFLSVSFHRALLFGGFITDLLVNSKVSEGNKKWGDIIFVSVQTGMLEVRFT